MRRAIVAIVSTAAGTVVLLGAKGGLGLADSAVATSTATPAPSGSAKPSAAAAAPPVPNQPAATPAKTAATGNGNGGNTNTGPANPAPLRMKDGSYLGREVSAGREFGTVQLRIQVQAGKLNQIVVIKSPTGSSNSVKVSTEAFKKMTAQALREQTAEVDSVSGATESCEAYRESLQAAMDAAYLA